MTEIVAAHLERVAKEAYDKWEAWHSEPCEQGQFEGKRYVSYPDMGSLGSEQKFVEVVAAALAARARESRIEAIQDTIRAFENEYCNHEQPLIGVARGARAMCELKFEAERAVGEKA